MFGTYWLDTLAPGHETPLSRIIRTARMIPLDLANPLVGMAGITTGAESASPDRSSQSRSELRPDLTARPWLRPGVRRSSRRTANATTTMTSRGVRSAEPASSHPGLAGVLDGLGLVGHGVPVWTCC